MRFQLSLRRVRREWWPRLILAAGLLVACVYIAWPTDPLAIQSVADKIDEAAIEAPPPPGGHDDAVEQIVSRPIFHPSRTPLQVAVANPASANAVAAPPPPPAPPLLTDCVALGIVTGPPRPSALIRPDRLAKSIIVHEGDSVKGWQVTRITPKFVELSYQGATQELRLSRQNHAP